MNNPMRLTRRGGGGGGEMKNGSQTGVGSMESGDE